VQLQSGISLAHSQLHAVSPLLPQAMENETLQEEASGPANTSNAQPVKQAETITRRTTRTTGAAAAAANPKPQALKAPRQAPADNVNLPLSKYLKC